MRLLLFYALMVWALLLALGHELPAAILVWIAGVVVLAFLIEG